MQGHTWEAVEGTQPKWASAKCQALGWGSWVGSSPQPFRAKITSPVLRMQRLKLREGK